MSKQMGFRSIVGKLTGFTTPWGGLSWQPTETEGQVAMRVITYLEDRRVLFDPYEIEVQHDAIRSIQEIRERLTHELSNLDRSTPLASHLAAMRTECRKFLTGLQSPRRIPSIPYYDGPGWLFYTALGELRGVFGVHIALIAVRYQLDVEADLASILPETTE